MAIEVSNPILFDRGITIRLSGSNSENIEPPDWKWFLLVLLMVAILLLLIWLGLPGGF